MKQVRPRLTAREQVFISELRGKECGYRPRLYLDEVEELIKFRDIESTRSERMPKILSFDIETAPNKTFLWGVWKQNANDVQIISEWYMICWAAKWLGDDEIISDSVTAEEILREDDSRIAKSLWELVNEADILIAHNGKRFDVPKMNTRFFLAGLPMPSPYEQVDTLLVFRSQFAFNHNKLDALAKRLGIPSKDYTNFQLWIDCIEGNQESLDYMETYCRNDIRILEQVYLKVLAWIPNHPNVALYLNDDVPVCHTCGSRNVAKDDSFKYTSVSKFPVLRCADCGSLSRERTTAMELDKRKVLLTRV